MSFKPIIYDPGICIRPEVNPDGEQYHEYVLDYVYDILGIIMDAKKLLL